MLNRLLGLLIVAASLGAQAQGVYRCPGPPVLYTDALSAKEASEKGCRTIEGTPITVMQTAKPRAGAGAGAAPATVDGARGAEGRVDAQQQRVRDDERRRVLQTELRQSEERLAAAQKEFNNGQGERRGDERNYQKYLDRMAELKDNVARYEADVQALKREIAKLP